MLQMFQNIFTPQQELPYTIDLHSHLLPGIDDGVKTMDEAIMLISKMKDLGFTKLITTPHIMKHRYANTSSIILNSLHKVQVELQKRDIDITLEAAAEYYLDEHLLELIEQKDILTFNANHLLFEMSYQIRPVYLQDAIYKMQNIGYQPVLAHPERYFFMHNNFDEYKQLKDSGVMFQINLNSLGGYYSKEAKKVALKLLDAGLIDFIGSDIHKIRHFEHFTKNYNNSLLKKLFTKNTILNHTLCT